MPFAYDPLSLAVHGLLRWRRPADAHYIEHHLRVNLAFSEMWRVAHTLPIVFLDVGAFVEPVGVCDHSVLSHILVGRDGQWTAPYMPFVLRMHPFSIVEREDGTPFLGVARDPSCVDAGFANALFEGDEPAPSLRAILRLGRRFVASCNRGRRAATALRDAGALSRLDRPAELAISFGRPVYVTDRSKLEGAFADLRALEPTLLADALHVATAAAVAAEHLRADIKPMFAAPRVLKAGKAASLIAVGDRAVSKKSGEVASFLVDDDGYLNFDVNASSRYFKSG